MYFKVNLILILVMAGSSAVMAQKRTHVQQRIYTGVTVPEGFENALIKIGDSVFVMMGNCKNSWGTLYSLQPVLREKIPVKQVPPFLTVHGNILYNYSYRSYIDTPFAQEGLQQHLVQTNLQFLIKDKYPLQMTITNRSSNSPYFKNLTDVNFSFNRRTLLENIKADLKQKAVSLVSSIPVTRAEEMLQKKMGQAKELQLWVNSPARVQEFEEEKEAALQLTATANLSGSGKSSKTPELKNISVKELFPESINNKLPALNKFKDKAATSVFLNKLQYLTETESAKIAATGKNKLLEKKLPGIKDSTLLEKYNTKKQELEKLLVAIKKDEAVVRNVKRQFQDSVNRVRQQISSLQNPASLFVFMKQNGIGKGVLTQTQKVLLSINQLGIGRNWIDYSELTVKNISIAGFNVEANPSPFYLAFAAGKMNYRFRDFIFKNNKSLPDQYVAIARAGLGQKEKNNFIVSYYNGKKSVLNTSASPTPALLQRVMGFSAETRLAVNASNYIIAEFAKSSFGNNSTSGQAGNLLHSAVNLKTRTNEAYSIKLYSYYGSTDTRLTAFYRKTGENFQSFNLFPVNVNQEAWAARLYQSFWKRRFMLDAAIRKNDFINPVALPSFASKTIFKSLQASLRVPKYPYVSVGYYPTSQLSLSNNNLLTENQYNTLNTVVNYSYKMAKISMNTNAVYTRFYNNSSDTGFIYYNAVSALLNHSFFIGRFTMQTGAALISQKDLRLFTLEQLIGWQLNNNFSLSGSLKWNRLNKSATLFGGTAALNIIIKRLGVFQFNYEKIYLPGYNRQLLPVDIGRAGFYRVF